MNSFYHHSWGDWLITGLIDYWCLLITSVRIKREAWLASVSCRVWSESETQAKQLMNSNRNKRRDFSYLPTNPWSVFVGGLRHMNDSVMSTHEVIILLTRAATNTYLHYWLMWQLFDLWTDCLVTETSERSKCGFVWTVHIFFNLMLRQRKA